MTTWPDTHHAWLPDEAGAVLVDIERYESVLGTDEIAITITNHGDDIDDIVERLIITPRTAAEVLYGLATLLQVRP